MDQEANQLAQYLVGQLHQIPTSQRLVIGISGIPASGKTSFARLIVNYTNKLLEVSSTDDTLHNIEAIVVSSDGWHLTREQLSKFPDPELAHARRGAHWTFDSVGYTAFVTALAVPLSSADASRILAPTFDHAIKDPVFDAICIRPWHRIVVIEGLYTFLDIEGWSQAAQMMNERWLISIEEDEAQKRLARRHVLTGITRSWEEAVQRAEQNDMPNGRYVLANMLKPTRVIRSMDDPLLASYV